MKRHEISEQQWNRIKSLFPPERKPQGGRPAEFSVRDVSDVSRSIGWIVLYDKEWKPLAKLDPGLEHLEMLEHYLAVYGYGFRTNY